MGKRMVISCSTNLCNCHCYYMSVLCPSSHSPHNHHHHHNTRLVALSWGKDRRNGTAQSRRQIGSTEQPPPPMGVIVPISRDIIIYPFKLMSIIYADSNCCILYAIHDDARQPQLGIRNHGTIVAHHSRRITISPASSSAQQADPEAGSWLITTHMVLFLAGDSSCNTHS